jgi:hypothetical protein
VEEAELINEEPFSSFKEHDNEDGNDDELEEREVEDIVDCCMSELEVGDDVVCWDLLTSL